MKIRVAVVQSLSGSGADENRNAIELVELASPAPQRNAPNSFVSQRIRRLINPSNNHDALWTAG